MRDPISDLQTKMDDLLTRQAQIEQGLHILLDAIQVQAPLLKVLSTNLVLLNARLSVPVQ